MKRERDGVSLNGGVASRGGPRPVTGECEIRETIRSGGTSGIFNRWAAAAPSRGLERFIKLVRGLISGGRVRKKRLSCKLGRFGKYRRANRTCTWSQFGSKAANNCNSMVTNAIVTSETDSLSCAFPTSELVV
ncbi:hypothetical protein EVAR_67559_1 [Eumeta japonica]|uniref:Uncharacterized protein n=1 Tax=Eumeta variegata TaxID=151549 RepID=A0A4C1ZI00_EUMVA|nr:hypothetical protein EVAR_67559_1 [Eumeta japonica]